jgi:hypothetical protein
VGGCVSARAYARHRLEQRGEDEGRHDVGRAAHRHAFARGRRVHRAPQAGVAVQSANGTLVGDKRAPRAGDGDPIVLRPGMAVRFGDINATFLDAEALHKMLST